MTSYTFSIEQQGPPYSPVSPSNPMHPMSPTPVPPNAMTRNVTIGGTQKKIVSNQFNSPMGMYSDETLVEVAESNQVTYDDGGSIIWHKI